MNAYQKLLLSTGAVLLVLGCIGAPYPEQMYLQHIPTVVAIAALAVLSRRYPLSNVAFTCLILFLLFHILGARYIYSYVPYDDWMKALIGTDLTSVFHFRRNHYDRLVHFAFGLLWVLPVWEVCVRYFKVPRRFAFYVAIEFVLAVSALYELFEWGSPWSSPRTTRTPTTGSRATCGTPTRTWLSPCSGRWLRSWPLRGATRPSELTAGLNYWYEDFWNDVDHWRS